MKRLFWLMPCLVFVSSCAGTSDKQEIAKQQEEEVETEELHDSIVSVALPENPDFQVLRATFKRGYGRRITDSLYDYRNGEKSDMVFHFGSNTIFSSYYPYDKKSSKAEKIYIRLDYFDSLGYMLDSKIFIIGKDSARAEQINEQFVSVRNCFFDKRWSGEAKGDEIDTFDLYSFFFIEDTAITDINYISETDLAST